MSSTTGDHINELEARRQRRHGRHAPSTGDANTPRGSKPAEEARDLLRDLITNGPSQGQDAAIASDVAGVTASQRTLEHLTSGASATEQPEPETHREGERVDELVRRVQASAQTVAADAAAATRKRRPTGTADLSPDAALRSFGFSPHQRQCPIEISEAGSGWHLIDDLPPFAARLLTILLDRGRAILHPYSSRTQSFKLCSSMVRMSVAPHRGNRSSIRPACVR